jgi:hypothetical protein
VGKLILVEGSPGTGKSTAIKNLDPSTTLIIRPNNKDLPFKGARKKYIEGENVLTVNSLQSIRDLLIQVNNGSKFKTVVVEDTTHLYSKRVMNESGERGYDKWVRLAVDIFNSFLDIEAILREDLYVIIIGHTQMTRDSSGNTVTNLQTPGRLLEDSIKIPSYFTYVLHSDVEDSEEGPRYYFLTNKDGSGKEAKSPEGCLELKEDNDYQLIINKIEDYQNAES